MSLQNRLTLLAAAVGADVKALYARPSGHTVQDEGTSLTARSKIDFRGAGVTVTDDSANDKSTVTIPGGGGSGSSAFAEIPLTAATSYTISGLDGDVDFGYEFYLMGSTPAGTVARNCVLVPNALVVPANAAFKAYRNGYYRENAVMTADNLLLDGIGFMFAPAYTTSGVSTHNAHGLLVSRVGSERVFKADFEASDASTILRVLHGTAVSKWTDTTTKITSLRFLSDGAFTGKLFWRKMVP